MNIVVVGTLTQESANKLAVCCRETDSITFLEQEDQILARNHIAHKADLVLVGETIDVDKLQGTMLAAGIHSPLFAASKPANETNKSTDDLSMLGTSGLRLGQKLADMERQLILETLTHCSGNRTWAADILGISIRTLRNKLLQYTGEGRTVAAPGERRMRSSATH